MEPETAKELIEILEHDKETMATMDPGNEAIQRALMELIDYTRQAQDRIYDQMLRQALSHIIHR